jgi:hypothetical protein
MTWCSNTLTRVDVTQTIRGDTPWRRTVTTLDDLLASLGAIPRLVGAACRDHVAEFDTANDTTSTSRRPAAESARIRQNVLDGYDR